MSFQLFLVLLLSYGIVPSPTDVIVVASTTMACRGRWNGLVIRDYPSDAVHRLSGVFIFDAKVAPVMMSGIESVLVVEI